MRIELPAPSAVVGRTPAPPGDAPAPAEPPGGGSTRVELGGPAVGQDRVVELLAGVLLSSPRFWLPGADGQTVADVVTAEYPVAAAAGWVPGPAALAAEHPELAGALAAFLRAVPAELAC